MPNFSRPHLSITASRLIVLLGALVFVCVVLACESNPRSEPRPLVSASADGINDPMARAGVRQEFIKDAVPENKPVVKQADATKSDLEEAKEAVTALQAVHTRQLHQQAAIIDALTADLASARSDEEKQYRKRMFWIKTIATVGIAAGIALCFLVGKAFIAISLGCVAMLIAISVDSFISKWAEPIAGGCLIVIALIGLWHLWMYLRSVKQLTTSGKVILGQTGSLTTKGKVRADIAAVLDRVQTPFTKRLVNKFNPTKKLPKAAT